MFFSSVSSFDECDLDSLDNQDLGRLHYGMPSLFDDDDDDDDDDDERAEANAQYSWGLEVQQEVAALTHRSR